MSCHHISDIQHSSAQAPLTKRMSHTVGQTSSDKMDIHIEHRRYLVSRSISIGVMKLRSDAHDFSHAGEDALLSRKIDGSRTNCS
jgi:hypothetical protein